MSTIPARLVDPILVVPASLYQWICIPMRVAIGAALVLLAVYNASTPTFEWVCAALGVMLLIAAWGLLLKWRRHSAVVWKNYGRAIAMLAAAGGLALGGALADHPELVIAAGALVIADAMMGQQSRFLATTQVLR